MKKSLFTLRLAIASLAIAVTTAANRPESLIATWNDGNFGSNWTFTGLTYGVNVTYSSSVPSSGGNPNAYVAQSINAAANPKFYLGRAVVLALNTNATWTPTTSPTAFTRMEATFDLRLNLSGPANYQLPLIKQGTKYYIDHNYPVLTGAWDSPGYHVTNLGANSFDEIDVSGGTLAINTSSHPNFTSGDTMTFGFAIWGEHLMDGSMHIGACDIDNWSVALYRL
jgi:hypothetical protein